MRELNSFIKGECLRLIPWNIIGSLLDVGGFRNRDLQEAAAGAGTPSLAHYTVSPRSTPRAVKGKS